VPIEIVERRNSVALTLGRLFQHAHDAVGVRVRQGPEEHAVDKAEDRGVRADAQGQRQDRNGGESGAAAQRSEGVSQVLRKW